MLDYLFYYLFIRAIKIEILLVLGFTTFLQKLVADDLESLSRTLYTKDYIRKSALSTFITNLHNSLRRTNQEVIFIPAFFDL